MYLWHQHDGFTLIDVMIGMVVLTIVSLGLMNLTVSTIRGNAFSNRMTAATTLAQDQLEHVKQLGFLNANTAAGTEHYGSLTAYPAFKRVTSVSHNLPATGISTVTVTVYWASDTRAVALQTLMAE
jgi:Tfp pilus assembly protein PilV